METCQVPRHAISEGELDREAEMGETQRMNGQPLIDQDTDAGQAAKQSLNVAQTESASQVRTDALLEESAARPNENNTLAEQSLSAAISASTLCLLAAISCTYAL
jgi:hypothetical protein